MTLVEEVEAVSAWGLPLPISSRVSSSHYFSFYILHILKNWYQCPIHGYSNNPHLYLVEAMVMVHSRLEWLVDSWKWKSRVPQQWRHIRQVRRMRTGSRAPPTLQLQLSQSWVLVYVLSGQKKAGLFVVYREVKFCLRFIFMTWTCF